MFCVKDCNENPAARATSEELQWKACRVLRSFSVVVPERPDHLLDQTYTVRFSMIFVYVVKNFVIFAVLNRVPWPSG